MRKILRNIFISALALSAAAACVDDRNNFMVDDSFGFNTAIDENLNEQPVYTGSYELALIKSGKGFEDATVFIEGNNAALAVYNKENNKNYAAIPAELYSFSSNSVEFKADEVVKKVTVTWDVKKVAEYMDQGAADEYVIPVGLKSYDLEVNDGRDLVILNLKKTNVTHEQKLLSWTLVYGENAAAVKESKNISVLLDKAPGMDLTLDFTADTDAIAAYNQANGTNYTLAPEGLISFEKSLTLANGELIKQLAVNLDASVLIGEDGTMPEFEGYVVPVRVSGTSVEGIVYENALTYVVVEGKTPTPPQLFERFWGLYTTSATAPWYAPLGYASGNDRNIAMDDEYIYVSSSSANAALKAISIADPTVIKDVNTEGVAEGTHLISCVRVIKNTDANINGGKDILIATNLGLSTTIFLYAWTNGIDAAPERIGLINTWRRIGDKFTVEGTWQQGELRFVDYNASQQAVVRFGIANGVPTGGTSDGGATYWPDGKFDINTGTTTDRIGECTMYPGSTQYALMNSNGAGVFAVDGALSEWSNDPGLALTYGYNFFSIGEKKYIAYFKLDGETHNKGAVVVLNDPTGTPEGFKAALEAQDVEFTAPIQDPMNEKVESPITASPYVGDCVVRNINGTVYMAVLQNGGGLSLFKETKL